MYSSGLTKIKTKGFLPKSQSKRDSDSSKSSNQKRFNSPELKDYSPIGVEIVKEVKVKQTKVSEDSTDANIADTVDMYNSNQCYNLKSANVQLLTGNNKEEAKKSKPHNKNLKQNDFEKSPTNSYGMQLGSPKNYYSKKQNLLQSEQEIPPMTTRHKDSESMKKIFTETRPQLTPQAVPKLLKFKFDEKTLRGKYGEQNLVKLAGNSKKVFENNKQQIDESEDCNVEEDEENVIDDSEEQSVFVMNQMEFIKNKSMIRKSKINEEIQTAVDKYESKFKSEEIEVNIIKENPKDKKHSQSYSSKLLILQEYYDKMNDMANINKLSTKQRLPYCYQLILNDITKRLTDLNKSSSSMHNRMTENLEIQLEINNKLEGSIHSLREKNNDLNVSLTRFKEKAKKEKKAMKETISNLNQRVEHLITDLKLQMVSANKIDSVREKLAGNVKELQIHKEELEKENEEYILTINELKQQIENTKSKGGIHEDGDHREFSQTKTKGTFSDKDDSQHREILEDRKSDCTEHLEKLKKLEKQNQELECELRKMMNISKQDTNNLSEIINQSLDVLNDISITIEVMAPISSTSYSSNQLTISSDKFTGLTKHK